MDNMNIMKRGTRVRLLANESEGWPEEFGTVLSYEGIGLYIVQVDEEYSVEGDDGIREVYADDMEKV